MMYVLMIFVMFVGESTDGNTEFPDNFLFGAGTSAYQIEGAWNSSGKGESIWDRLVHTRPNMMAENATGDIACDSFNKYCDDVKLLAALGVDFYRFSISWSRLLPSGISNRINQQGVKYYCNLIDSLQKSKIAAMVTLYHWDMPQQLQDLGGWANPIMVNYFVQYAAVCFKKFGSKVRYWITFNDPGHICEDGYGMGLLPPMVNSSGIGEYLCGRNVLLAHAKVYHLYHNHYERKFRGKLGITLGTPWYEPKGNCAEDKHAAERAMQMEFGWWAHPIFSKKGDYPKIMRDRIYKFSKAENFSTCRLPHFTKAEVKFIRGSFSFMGLNHYTTFTAKNDEKPINCEQSHEKDVGVKMEQNPQWPSSASSSLQVVPWGFTKLLYWIKKEYNNPCVFITENGFPDKGGMRDIERINYHATYLRAMLKAIKKYKCNVRGYAVWSLMDNLDWRDGYTIKYGLYSVDFKDGDRPRTAKMSQRFFKTLIQTREVPAICFDEGSSKADTCGYM